MLRLEVWSAKADSSKDFFLKGGYLDGERPRDCLMRCNPEIAEYLQRWEAEHPELDDGFDSLSEIKDFNCRMNTLEDIRRYMESGEYE